MGVFLFYVFLDKNLQYSSGKISSQQQSIYSFPFAIAFPFAFALA